MLDFVWYAELKDGSFLGQFENLETQAGENSFKRVLDAQADLVRFHLLYARDSGRKIRYTVNLVDGTICRTDGDELLADLDMLRDGAAVYRLIYFRRITRTFSTGLQEMGQPIIVYFLGFQYIDENGKNHKRLVKIDGNGNMLVN